jgi:uncharacterized membrane protein
MGPKNKESVPFFLRVWRFFLSGVLLSVPFLLTLYICWSAITTLDQWVKDLLPGKSYIEQWVPFGVPGWGILLAFFGFTTVGFLSANYGGSLLLKASEALVNRAPLVRGIYHSVKQVLEALVKRNKTSFREVVLLEYPRCGLWAMGFVTGDTPADLAPGPQEMVCVFIPTTPNPTSGFLLFAERKDLTVLPISVEEGIKMVVSTGLITPKPKKPLAG